MDNSQLPEIIIRKQLRNPILFKGEMKADY